VWAAWPPHLNLAAASYFIPTAAAAAGYIATMLLVLLLLRAAGRDVCGGRCRRVGVRRRCLHYHCAVLMPLVKLISVL
jgi:hypothetical protein